MRLYQQIARWHNLRGIYNYCCAYCGATDGQVIYLGNWNSSGRTLILCVDHVQTQYNGGSCNIENLQILCNRCNGIKGEYYLPKLEPRQPEYSMLQIIRSQIELQSTMGRRRRTLPDNYISKLQLGY
jgi:hypothetical protein